MNIELVLPSEKYKGSYINALKEFQEEGRNIDMDINELEKDFSSLVLSFKNESEGKNLKKGYVPATTYWLIVDDNYVGRISVRHELTESLLQVGGHIGYEIRPTERGKGYGTMILNLVIPKVKELGIKKALLTCDSANIASKKIIEHEGGIFENEILGEEGKTSKLRYWINI